MDKEDSISLPKLKRSESRCRAWARARLPVLAWAARYSREAAVGDLVAGLTLGLTLVPQSIAYASLANLPVQYGLYSSFMGTMLYVVFGTVKEVSIGPTSLTALLTLQTCRDLPLEYVPLLSFLSGCVVLLMGLLRLGFLVELISPAVTSGFTSGTAVIIVVAQLKGLLGLSFVAESVRENVQYIAARWREVRLADCLLGLGCCAVLLTLRRLQHVGGGRRARRVLWLLAIGRNALVVCAASLLAYFTYDPEHLLFRLSGRVEPGLPPLALPAFSVTRDNVTVPFGDMLQELGSGLALVPVVMVLANIAIAKAFAQGGRVDATQEMVTLGLCNVAGSLVSAMPACGAFTRSAVSHASGVRSPAAGLYSGIITLLALAFMTEFFYFIPKACLSAVLICAVIFMVDVSTVRALWRHSREEVAVLALTFGVTVAFSVELGVLAGALASLARLLRALAAPPAPAALHTLKVAGEAPREAVVVRPALALLYLSAARFGRRLRDLSARAAPRPLLVDCSGLALFDYTAAQELERLLEQFESEGRQLVVYNASAEVLARLEALPRAPGRVLRARCAADALQLAGAGAGPAEGGPAQGGPAEGGPAQGGPAKGGPAGPRAPLLGAAPHTHSDTCDSNV